MNSNTEKETTRQIITLLGWLCFEDYQAYFEELWKTGKIVATPYPVSWFSTRLEQWLVFYDADQDAQPFSPLTRLEDAWQFVEHIREKASYSVKVLFISRMQSVKWWTLSHVQMCEAICQVALQAYGVTNANDF